MQHIKVDTGIHTLDVEVYAPVQKTKAPVAGILLLHEMMGLLDCYRKDAQDLADRGYLVYVPNLYTHGAMRYCIGAMVNAAGRRNTRDNPLNQEIHALLDALKSDERCNGRLGVLGACMTGGYVLHMAQRNDVQAPVLYHHGLGIEGAGIAREDESSLQDIQRLQAHFANIDIYCPRKKQQALKDALGQRLESYNYNMPHGFRSTARAMSGSKVVWQRTVAFFDTHLKHDAMSSDEIG